MTRPRRLALVLAASLAAAAGGTFVPRAVYAQTPEELTAARNLFNEALQDEDAHRYDVALEKYERVRQVRDTAPIRYRIGSSHEGLGHLAQALASYQSAVDIGLRESAQADVVKAARARIDALWKRVPRLSLYLSAQAPAGSEVRIDDRPVLVTKAKEPTPVDPGEHTVTATAPGAKPFRTVVSVPIGGEVSLLVPLDPEGTPAEPSASVPPSSAPASSAAPGEAPRDPGSGRRMLAISLLAAGGALVLGGTAAFLVRHGDIAEIEKSCAPLCPRDREAELTSARDRAQTLGPVSVILGVAGVLGIGAGTYLLLTMPSPPKAAKSRLRVAPDVTTGFLGVRLSGSF